MSGIKTSEFRRQINARWIGYDPDEMEAAHIANGLYLQVMGEQYTAEDVNRIAVIAERKGPIEAHSTEKLLHELTAIEVKDEETFNLFRQHVRQHVGADGALFDRHTGVGCAYSAASAQLVTDDRHNDGWSGNFVGFLLEADFGNGPSPVLSKLKQTLIDTSDPVSTMLLPVLDSEKKVFDRTYNDLDRQHFFHLIGQLPDLSELRAGFDTFAEYYPTYLSKQRFTRLLVILSSATLLRHITMLAQAWTDSNRLPFLIDTTQNTSSRLRFASQLSYIRCVVTLTEMYTRLVMEYILERAETLYRTTNFTLKMIKDASIEICQELNELLKNKHFDIDDNIQDWNVLAWQTAHHIVETLFDKNNYAASFFRSVGIRCGMLMPRGNYPRKHFFLQPDTITAFTLACMAPNEAPMTMSEFAETLWTRFGILVGGRVDDMATLHAAAIRDVNEDDLNLNYRTFTQMMVALGLAQRRSDGLVLVHPLQK